MARQFYACRFRTADTRDYAYHWEGEPFMPGAEVKVPDRKGDGWMRVYVVARYPADFAPKFETKAILGQADPLPAEEAEKVAADLGKDAARVLAWLAKEDSSAYGECHGPALDKLVAERLAMVADPGGPPRDIGYSRVFLTDRGHAVAKAVPADQLDLGGR